MLGSMSAIGPKQTWADAPHMSAFGAERTSLLLPRNSLLVRNNSLFLLLGNFELNSAPWVQIGVSEVAGGRNFGEFPVKFPVSRETGAEQGMICTATPASQSRLWISTYDRLRMSAFAVAI